LTRAATTAEAIFKVQTPAAPGPIAGPMLINVPELREQDFGLFEGTPVSGFNTRAEDPRQRSVETSEEMAVRARVFIREYLAPLTGQGDGAKAPVVAVVSHGCLLRVLWREVLEHFKPTGVRCEQQMLLESQSIDFMRLGHWSNTGFLEVLFERVENQMLVEVKCEDRREESNTKIVEDILIPKAHHWSATILGINVTDHLKTLKRTRGGIGSSQYDSRQKTLDRFFTTDNR
jgi:histidine phosphatase superfamily protein (branch 1)